SWSRSFVSSGNSGSLVGSLGMPSGWRPAWKTPLVVRSGERRVRVHHPPVVAAVVELVVPREEEARLDVPPRVALLGPDGAELGVPSVAAVRLARRRVRRALHDGPVLLVGERVAARQGGEGRRVAHRDVGGRAQGLEGDGRGAGRVVPRVR